MERPPGEWSPSGEQSASPVAAPPWDGVWPWWLDSVPQYLLEWLVWDPANASGKHSLEIPEGAWVLLYAGPDDPEALDRVLISLSPLIRERLVVIEIQRLHSQHGDMLGDVVWACLCQAAVQGRLAGIIGGPNCKTWSVRLLIPRKGGGVPKRGRWEPDCWGLPKLSTALRRKTDEDSALMLRQLFLTWLAKRSGRDPGYFLEHPEDPAKRSTVQGAHNCSSIWATKLMRQWLKEMGSWPQDFDQCQMGQVVAKHTTVATSLDLQWHGWFCDHGNAHDSSVVEDSADLARYPPDMQYQLAMAIVKWDEQAGWQSLRYCDPVTDRPVIDIGRVVPPTKTAIVSVGFKKRPLRDGGGKPSPGRLLPPDRQGGAAALGAETPSGAGTREELAGQGLQILEFLKPNVHEFWAKLRNSSKAEKKALDFRPYSKEFEEEVLNILSPRGVDRSIAPGQPFRLGVLRAVLSRAGDPDVELPGILEHGAPLGVDEATLCTPGIWPTKSELTSDFGIGLGKREPGDTHAQENYDSSARFMEEIRETLIKERAMDMVEGPFQIAEAAKVCGCTPGELHHGALGAVEEAEKVRTIYDGSVSGANDWIRQNSNERTTLPTIVDGAFGAQWLRTFGGTLDGSPGRPWWSHKEKLLVSGKQVDTAKVRKTKGGAPEDKGTCLLVADVSMAHRRVKVLKSGWKYQVVNLDGEFWVNKVGTYGIASAQLYWGRVAAALLRLGYALFPMIDWAFVFVDDFALLLEQGGACLMGAAFLIVLAALGCPFSWHKVELGKRLNWLGFSFWPDGPQAHPKEEKMVEMVKILEVILLGVPVAWKDVEQLTGRLLWASSAVPFSKPFLYPLFKWKSKTHSKYAHPSKMMSMVAGTFLELLKSEQPFPKIDTRPARWTGASDASIRIDHAGIGGWISDDPKKDKKEVWWFYEEVTEADFPFLFVRGTAQQHVSGVELLGSLFLIDLLLAYNGTDNLSELFIPCCTDNQGNAMAIMNEKTKAWPNAGMMMQLADLLTRKGCSVKLEYTRRNINKWSDALANGTTEGFSPNKRWRLDLSPSKWPLLFKLSEVANEFESRKQTKRKTAEGGLGSKKRRTR